MDRIDRKILRQLVGHGRSTQFELAEAAGLSPSAAARRQKALEEGRVISGYHAELNLRQLGYATTVIVSISLDSQSDEALSAFEAAAAVCPSVLRCHLMSGSDDYLLTVVARSIQTIRAIWKFVQDPQSGWIRLCIRDAMKADVPLNARTQFGRDALPAHLIEDFALRKTRPLWFGAVQQSQVYPNFVGDRNLSHA